MNFELPWKMLWPLLVSSCKLFFSSSQSVNFQNLFHKYLLNQYYRHVCTCLNAFFIVIPNDSAKLVLIHFPCRPYFGVNNALDAIQCALTLIIPVGLLQVSHSEFEGKVAAFLVNWTYDACVLITVCLLVTAI